MSARAIIDCTGIDRRRGKAEQHLPSLQSLQDLPGTVQQNSSLTDCARANPASEGQSVAIKLDQLVPFSNTAAVWAHSDVLQLSTVVASAVAAAVTSGQSLCQSHSAQRGDASTNTIDSFPTQAKVLPGATPSVGYANGCA